MKSQLHYYHTAYYSCSYVVNSVHEHFAVKDSLLQILQHQERLKHENFAVSFLSQLHHITTTKHFSENIVVHFTLQHQQLKVCKN